MLKHEVHVSREAVRGGDAGVRAQRHDAQLQRRTQGERAKAALSGLISTLTKLQHTYPCT